MKTTMLAVLSTVAMVTGAVAEDGARAYHLTPAGTDIISLTMNAIETQLAGNTYNAGVLTPSFSTAVDVGGNAGTLLIGLPIGGLSADFGSNGVVDLENDVAIGDMYVGAQVGLIGSPSLSPMEYAMYKPGFRLGLAGKLFMPTGDYDSSRPINLGSNRWSFQASMPMSYVLADSMIDPQMTTFELVPTVVIFSDNNDPFAGLSADTVSKDPIFALEAQVTHNFSSMIWGAVGGAYIAGGETYNDGASNNDYSELVSLEATLGLVLSPEFSLRARYNEVVWSKDPATDGRGFELSAAYTF